MRSASLSPSVEATSPPTLTWAPWPNSMPLGLTRNTWPLAVRVPRIAEGSAPSTRLSATELLLGWTKLTLLPCAMLKESQLIATAWLVWVTVTVFGACEIVAAPAETVPPVGRLCALRGAGQAERGRRPMRIAVEASRMCGCAGVVVWLDVFMVKFPCDPSGFECAGSAAQKSLMIWNQARPARSGGEVAGSSPSRGA